MITSLRHRNVIGDELDDLNGLYSRAPVEAVLMLIFMLSLAGIPPLAGFWGKYFIFLSLIETGHYVLASLGVLYSVFGLYYYLKIANAMFMGKAEKGEERLPVSLTHARRACRGRHCHPLYRHPAGPFHRTGELGAGHRAKSQRSEADTLKATQQISSLSLKFVLGAACFAFAGHPRRLSLRARRQDPQKNRRQHRTARSSSQGC